MQSHLNHITDTTTIIKVNAQNHELPRHNTAYKITSKTSQFQTNHSTYFL